MLKMLSRVSPGAITMLRMDHTHALMTFHRYHADTSPGRKRAIVDVLSIALDVHTRLEEEIFYPAMRSVDPDLVQESYEEHGEMKRLIDELSRMEPADREYDLAVMALMREVLRHVADEETKLFPDAERVLGEERLAELGAEMTRRRMQLVAPRTGEITVQTARTFPAATAAVAGIVGVAGYLVARALYRPSALRALTS
jgi:hypothetical protein